MAIYAFPKDFRSHVGSCAAEGVDIIVVFSAKSQIAYLGHISIIFSASIAEQEYIFGLDVAVDQIPLVDMAESFEHAADDIGALLELKNGVVFLALYGVDIAAVAVLHEYEYPSLVCIVCGLPSKVRVSLTMLGWSSSLMLWISCSMYLTR